MKKIDVIVKASDSCNLRCKYCYNASRGFSSRLLPIEKLEKLFSILTSEFDEIDVVWHGGEPLCAGEEYFKKAMELEEKLTFSKGVNFVNQIQTNGTLINKKWVKFFKKYHFGVGISYDGINNDKYRQKGELTLKGMKLLKEAGIRFGCIAVVGDKDYDLHQNYEFFKKLGAPVVFALMFLEGNAKELDKPTSKEYADKFIKLFDEWIVDKDGTSVRLFDTYIVMALGGRFRVCENCSCHTKYISINSEGNLFNCGREAVMNYPFGNIDDYSTYKEIFASSGAVNLLKGSIERRNKCKESCEYFSLCKGGCADNAILEGKLEDIPKESCSFFKLVYPHVKAKVDEIMKNQTPLEELNPSFKRILLKNFKKSDRGNEDEIALKYTNI